MTKFDYAGRVVIITGAGRGIGRDYALAFAARGASVVVNDLGSTLAGASSAERPADAVVADIIAAGGRAVASHDSVSTAEGATAIIETALKAFGRIDTLINNAGILEMKPFTDVTLEGLERHLSVHVIGTFLMCKAVWPHMIGRGYGRIVNTVSGGMFGLPRLTEYGPAKGAVFAFTRGLALEAIEHGIRVNAIAPQAATRMLQAAALAPELRAQLEQKMKTTLVSPGALYLGHELCTLNGETLAVSGGKVCRIGLTYNEGFTDPALTPDMISERLAEVLDEASARVWTSAASRYEARAQES